jgi:hypothetical protein
MVVTKREAGNERIIFVVYTVLGYVALSLHNGVFAPDLAEEPTDVRAILVLLNLAVGTWCFLRALRGLWKAELAE